MGGGNSPDDNSLDQFPNNDFILGGEDTPNIPTDNENNASDENSTKKSENMDDMFEEPQTENTEIPQSTQQTSDSPENNQTHPSLKSYTSNETSSTSPMEHATSNKIEENKETQEEPSTTEGPTDTKEEHPESSELQETAEGESASYLTTNTNSVANEESGNGSTSTSDAPSSQDVSPDNDAESKDVNMEDGEDADNEEKSNDEDEDEDMDSISSPSHNNKHEITEGVTVMTVDGQQGDKNTDNNSINEGDINTNGTSTNNLTLESGVAPEEEDGDSMLDEDNEDEENHREKSTDFETSPSVAINDSEAMSRNDSSGQVDRSTEINTLHSSISDTNPSKITAPSANVPTIQASASIMAETTGKVSSVTQAEVPKDNTEISPVKVESTNTEGNNNAVKENENKVENGNTKQEATAEDDVIIPQTHEIVIPSYVSWFNLKKIHHIERKSLPEFFTNRIASKTSEIYIKYRNFMVNTYRLNPNEYFSVTSARRNLSGDAASIFRIHKFLMKWGLINYQVGAQKLPKTVEPPYTSKFSTKHDAPRGIFPFESYKPSVQLPDMAKLKKMMDTNDDKSTLYKYLTQERKRSIEDVENGDNKIITNVPEGQGSDEQEKAPASQHSIKRPRILENISNTSEKIKWSREDLKKLLFGIQTHGSDWYKVAKHVGSKTPEQCILRFLQLPIEDKFLFQDTSKLPNGSSTNEQTSVVNVSELGPLKFAPHLPFSKSENPVLSTIAFLVGLVDPKVVQQMTSRAIKAMVEDTKEVAVETATEEKRIDDTHETTTTKIPVGEPQTESVPESASQVEPLKDDEPVAEDKAELPKVENSEHQADTIAESDIAKTEADGSLNEQKATDSGIAQTEDADAEKDVDMPDASPANMNSLEDSIDNSDGLFGDDNSDDDDSTPEADNVDTEEKNEESKDKEVTEEKERPASNSASHTTPDDSTENVEHHDDVTKEHENSESGNTEKHQSTETDKELEPLINATTESHDQNEPTSKETKTVVSTQPAVATTSNAPEEISTTHLEHATVEENNDVKNGSEIAIASLGLRSHVFANNEERQMNKLTNQMIQVQLEKLETKLKIFDKLEKSLEFDKKKLERKQEEFLVQRLAFAKSSNTLIDKFDKALGIVSSVGDKNANETGKLSEGNITSLTKSVAEMKDLVARPLRMSLGPKITSGLASDDDKMDVDGDFEGKIKPVSIENPQVYRYWSA